MDYSELYAVIFDTRKQSEKYVIAHPKDIESLSVVNFPIIFSADRSCEMDFSIIIKGQIVGGESFSIKTDPQHMTFSIRSDIRSGYGSDCFMDGYDGIEIRNILDFDSFGFDERDFYAGQYPYNEIIEEAREHTLN